MITATKSKRNLRQLADNYEATVKVRMAIEKQLWDIEHGTDEAPGGVPGQHDELAGILRNAERVAQRDMEIVAAQHPCFKWGMGIPGVNRTVLCRILGLVGDIHGFPTFSKLRAWSGYAPGKDKLTKGEKAPYNVRLKKACYVAFDSMNKQASRARGKPDSPTCFYPDIYAYWRIEYAKRHGIGSSATTWFYGTDKKPARSAVEMKREANFRIPVLGTEVFQPGQFTDYKEHVRKNGKTYPAWPDKRQHHAAIRKAMDVFLYHLWETWRTVEGLDVPDPYVKSHLGHQHLYRVEDFTRQSLAERKIKELGLSEVAVGNAITYA